MSFWKNKVVWITGASSGIGEALALALSPLGARLILSSRRKEELERVKGNCPGDRQHDIRILPLDLSESSTLHLSTAAAIQAFGHIDMLINNGGVGQRSSVINTTLEMDRQIMEVDYFGAVALTKYLLSHFINRKAGHIVVVSSVMGKFGSPNRATYAAAKHALHGFFDSLRAELWKESPNIYVTLICPGWVRTKIRANALSDRAASPADTTPKGMSSELFAKKMIHVIRKKKNEAYLGGPKEVWGVRLKRFFPNLFARTVRNVKVR